MWSADNGDQPSLPPPPSSPRSNKKKSRAGVNTGGVVNLFGNGFSGPAILFLIFLAGLRGEGMGREGMGWDEMGCSPRCSGPEGEGQERCPGSGAGQPGLSPSGSRWRGSAEGGRGGRLGWDVIDGREELSQ